MTQAGPRWKAGAGGAPRQQRVEGIANFANTTENVPLVSMNRPRRVAGRQKQAQGGEMARSPSNGAWRQRWDHATTRASAVRARQLCTGGWV